MIHEPTTRTRSGATPVPTRRPDTARATGQESEPSALETLACLAGEEGALRPALLVATARSHALALARHGRVGLPGERARLAEREAMIELRRRTARFAWRASTHVEALGALMALDIAAGEPVAATTQR
ncbi:MAG: hypothetical protein AAFV86_06130 [Pseudomonadota bacterium]